MQLEEIARLINGQLNGTSDHINGFSIDTRTLQKGQCYVAIIGERLNGHDFVNAAKEHGASALIVSEKGRYDLPYILVEDTVEAIGALALHHRLQFSLPVIALTGSCGKTTVKEMISSVLPKPSFATKGNLNNHIGVPLSLLALEKKHRYAVFELGANHIGEIKRTVSWVKPDVALITNVQPAHLDGFGSIEGVAQAKAEIFSGLKANGIAVINIDDSRIREKANRLSHMFLTYSLSDKSADVYSEKRVSDANGAYSFILCLKGDKYPIRLNVPGEHNVMNAITAATACHALGIEQENIQKGLASFSGVLGRMTEKKGLEGASIIDDTYNANLFSVKAAIDVLAHHKGKRILVLGELAEVDVEKDAHYAAIAQYAKQHNIDLLMSCGRLSAKMFKTFQNEQKHFSDKVQLIRELKTHLSNTTTILIKGSRSARMEEVVDALSINL